MVQSVRRRKVPFAVIAILTLEFFAALTAPVLSGCRRTEVNPQPITPLTTPKTSLRLLVLLDDTASLSLEQRQQNVQFLVPAIRAGIGRIPMTFCVFDTQVRELGTPNFRSLHDFFDMMKDTYFTQPEEQGTYFAPVAQRIREEAARAERAHQRLIVVCLTDAGFNDAPEIPRLAGTMKGLSSLDLLVLGPMTYQRDLAGKPFYDQIKADFADFEESRVMLFPYEKRIAATRARDLEYRIR